MRYGTITLEDRMKRKQRVRCSTNQFLNAVYSSKTYEEVSEKTGQKISSTIARYSRIKKDMLSQNIMLPKIVRRKQNINSVSIPRINKIMKKLKEHHSNM